MSTSINISGRVLAHLHRLLSSKLLFAMRKGPRVLVTIEINGRLAYLGWPSEIPFDG